MTPPEAWKRIVCRLIKHGWKPPNESQSIENVGIDTYESAAPELEELLRNGQMHAGMTTLPRRLI